MLLVSFGEQNGALRWLEENNCSHEMVLDPERKVTVLNLFALINSQFRVKKIYLFSSFSLKHLATLYFVMLLCYLLLHLK